MSSNLVATVEPVLSPEEIEQFIQLGFVVVKDCFPTGPGTLVQRWIDESWAREGIDRDQPDSWPTKPRVYRQTEQVSVREFAPKAYAAIAQIMGGLDRIRDPDIRWANNFLANLAVGWDEPWVAPGRDTFSGTNWHVDGSWFVHYLDGPEQGILGIVCWDRMVHRGGATFIAPDSIGPVAQFLLEHPEGVWPDDFPWASIMEQCSDFREVIADAGDFVLTHPLMMHRGSQNSLRRPRFMNNSVVSFREPLRFDPAHGPLSPVESCILRHLGEERVDFRIAGERRFLNAEDLAAYRMRRKKN